MQTTFLPMERRDALFVQKCDVCGDMIERNIFIHKNTFAHPESDDDHHESTFLTRCIDLIPPWFGIYCC